MDRISDRMISLLLKMLVQVVIIVIDLEDAESSHTALAVGRHHILSLSHQLILKALPYGEVLN